jgi:hypothetical protein
MRRSTSATLIVSVILGVTAWGCGSDGSGPGDGDPPNYQLSLVSGNNQTGTPGSALAQSLVIKYVAPNGTAAPATAVTWSGAGIATSSTTTSASTGTSSNQWTIPAGAVPGTPVTVTATISGETPVTFTASVTAPPAGACSGTGGTIHTNHVTATETWSLAASPHRVNARVEVQNGATLTVEPGAVLCFLMPAQVGDPNGGLNVVNGSLQAIGTSAAPIQFIRASTANPQFVWNGLQFAAGTTSHLDHAIVEYTLVLVHGTLLSDSTTFSNTTTIFIQPASTGTQITRARVEQHPQAGNFAAVSIFGATNTVFSGRVHSPSWWGIEVVDVVNLTIQDCEVANNGNAGIHVLSQFAQTNVTISGCNIFNNTGQGVQNGGSGNATVMAQGNWWGDPAGPAGPNGDGVSANVDASNPLGALVVLNY